VLKGEYKVVQAINSFVNVADAALLEVGVEVSLSQVMVLLVKPATPPTSSKLNTNLIFNLGVVALTTEVT
jgi:hypothetical protein